MDTEANTVEPLARKADAGGCLFSPRVHGGVVV